MGVGPKPIANWTSTANGDLAIYWKSPNLSSRKRERAREECHHRPPTSNKNREKRFWWGPHEKENKRSHKERSGMKGNAAQQKGEGGRRTWRLGAERGGRATTGHDLVDHVTLKERKKVLQRWRSGGGGYGRGNKGVGGWGEGGEGRLGFWKERERFRLYLLVAASDSNYCTC